jgi:hypothetical protein
VAGGHVHGPLHGAVGHPQVPAAAPYEALERQLPHLAGAQQQDRPGRQLVEDPGRQIHRRAGHADRRRAHPGLGADALGHGERLVQQPVQRRSHRAELRRLAIPLLDLPGDLGLAQHQRVQGAADPEQVLHGLFVPQPQQVRGQVVHRHARVARQDRLQIAGAHPAVHVQDLDPVAGVDDHRFGDARHRAQLAQQRVQPVPHGEPLAHLDRGDAVVGPDEPDPHGSIRAPRRPPRPAGPRSRRWRTRLRGARPNPTGSGPASPPRTTATAPG